MSLVENIINQISTQGAGGITKPQGFDLNDDTFSKLLDKQLDNLSQVSSNSLSGEMGMPAGLIIEPYEGLEFADNAQNQMDALGETKITNGDIEQFEIKDIDMDNYFSNLLKASNDNSSDLMNFAKRQATSAYTVFGKSFVTDMADFVQDIASTI